MRLISFLGTGDYSETAYAFDGGSFRTRYVAHALAALQRPTDVHLAATDEAWARHGGPLAAALAADGLPAPDRIPVPASGAPEHLWTLFSRLVESLRSSTGPVLLDITHGFRMQPFFAAACIQYVQAVLPDPPPFRVVYGEFRAGQPESPVWELTPFLDVLSWSRGLQLFLRTGLADDVAAPADRLAREVGREWAAAGRQGPQPQLGRLARAIQSFSDDFTTVRAGAMLAGKQPSARRLADAIRETSDEAARRLPTLALALDQVRRMAEPLADAGKLSSPSGQRALLALARLYQRLGRHSEAISVLREGWISLGAPDAAAEPGPGYDRDQRHAQEESWRNTMGRRADTVSEIRNDIQHAGFNPQPNDRRWFGEQLKKLLGEWERAIEAMPQA